MLATACRHAAVILLTKSATAGLPSSTLKVWPFMPLGFLAMSLTFLV